MTYFRVCTFFVLLFIIEAKPMAERIGPCPGLPLESYECFQRLYDTYVEVANMTDIIARNWAITLWYQDISHSFQKLLHTAPDSTPNLPSVGIWPSVAVWASNAVGFSIRQQPVPELWSYIIRDLPQWMQDILDKMSFKLITLLFKEIFAHTATALGAGNVFVFREIALGYVQYGLTFCNQTVKPDDSKMSEFIDKYVCLNGQCDFARGLWALFRAHFPVSESITFSERDQLLLAQGMYVGLAEQTHLQPFINASLPGFTTHWCDWWPNPNRTQCDDLVNAVITKILVHIFIGSHRLLADHDIPENIHNGSSFSPYLANLTVPETRNFLLQVLNSTTLHLNHTAATDWNSLAQRVRFVAPLFWVFQDHEDLNCFPFSIEQEYLIRTNQSAKMDPDSWVQICDKDCCADNGRWNGSN